MRTAQTHPQVASIHEAIVATRDPGLAHHVEDYGEQPVAVDAVGPWPRQRDAVFGLAERAIEASLEDLDSLTRAKEAAAANRQRHEDEALADATNVVERMRDRNGRRVMSPHDGKAIRDVWTILRGIQQADVGADSDGAWR